MLAFVARRLAATVVLLVAITALTFALVGLAPGDTAFTLAGSGGADPEYLALLRNRLGLDRPLIFQLGSYLWATAQGDLGFSVVQGRPVLDIILSRLPATLLLSATAIAISSVGGVFLGLVAAARRGSRLDAAVSVGSLVAYSVPVFWLGQLLVGLFAVRLRWLPASGMTTTGASQHGLANGMDLARHLVLPVVTFSLLLVGLIVRTTRVAAIEPLYADYVRAARGRGIPERRLLFRHVLPNAIRPVITVVTAQVGLLLTGAVLVETVFAWPGLGRLLFESVLKRDTPLLVGLLLFSSLVVALANLVADVLYRVIDPRLRP